jgi:hypothetical protein
VPKEMGVTAPATPMPIQARGRFHRNTAVAGRRWRGAGPAQGGLNLHGSRPILRAWPRSPNRRRSRLGGARGLRLRQSQAAALGQPHRSLFYLFALFPSARAPLRTTLYAGSTLHARPKIPSNLNSRAWKTGPNLPYRLPSPRYNRGSPFSSLLGQDLFIRQAIRNVQGTTVFLVYSDG